MNSNTVTFKINVDNKELQASLKKTSKQFSSVAKKASLVFAGVSAATIGLTSQFSKFEKQVTTVKTLLDPADLVKYSDTIDNLATKAVKDFGFSLDKSGKALFDTISALGANDRAFETYNEALKLAIGGNADLAVATDGLTSVMNAFKKENLSATRAAQIFFSAQKKGKTDVQKLASSIGKVAPQADALGISFEKTAASLATLTLAGLGTEEATTRLNAFFISLIQNRDELKKLGIEITDINGNFNSLESILEALFKTTGGNVVALQDLLKNQRAVSGAVNLIGDGMKKFNEVLKSTRTGTNQLSDAFDLQSKRFGFAVKKFIGTITIISVVLGEILAPEVLKVTSLIEKMGNGIIRNPGLAKFLAFSLSGTVALSGLVAVVGFAVSGFITLGAVILKAFIIFKAFSAFMLVSPLGLIISGATLAVAALTAKFIELKNKTATIGDAFKVIVNSVKIGINNIQIFFLKLFTSITLFIKDVKIKALELVSSITITLNKMINKLLEPLKLIPGIGKIISKVISKAEGNEKEIDNRIKKLKESQADIKIESFVRIANLEIINEKIRANTESLIIQKDVLVKTDDTTIDKLLGMQNKLKDAFANLLGGENGSIIDTSQFAQSLTDSFVAAMQGQGDAFSNIGKTISDQIWSGIGNAFFKPIAGIINKFVEGFVDAIVEKLLIKEAGKFIGDLFFKSILGPIGSFLGFSSGGDVAKIATKTTGGLSSGGYVNNIITSSKVLSFANGGFVPEIPNGDKILAGFRPDEFVLDAKDTSSLDSGDFAMVGTEALATLRNGGQKSAPSTINNFDFSGANFSDGITDETVIETFTKASEMISSRELIFNAG